MKTITIGFSKSKKKFAIGSWLIRKWMKTPYSHVYLKFRSESLGRILIYEAVGSGVRFIGRKIWEDHAEEVASFDIEITQENYTTLIQYCVDNAGLEYGALQNIGVVFCNLFKIKSNPFKKGKNCSEAISDILKLEGYKFEKESNLIVPKDIFNLLSLGQ